MATLRWKNISWLLLTLVVIALDQASKWALLKYSQPYQPIEILPVLNFTLSFNTGAAFSFLNNENGWQRWLLSGIALIISIYMIPWMLRTDHKRKWLLAAFALIIGGAVSNLIDRLRSGYVTDFIDFHIRAWHFAIFNIADAAISIGAVILVIYFLFGERYGAD